MLIQKIAFQTLQRKSAILQSIVDTAVAAPFNKLTVTIAYATFAGCRDLVTALSQSMEVWDEVQKTWFVSIDNGITSPEALELLTSIPNSTVFIPNARKVLSVGLRPRTLFHNKCYVFENDENICPLGILSTSANLTVNGLHLNSEQALSVIFDYPLSTKEEVLLKDVNHQRVSIEDVFSISDLLNNEILQLYSEKREQLTIPPNRESELSDILNEKEPVIEKDAAITLSTASAFWVEVGYVVENLGRGRPGNQIDLQRGTRVFFGFSSKDVPRNTVLGSVSIKYSGETSACSIRFGNNQMDKLNLPIPGVSGPSSYKNSTLLFMRENDGSFNLIVGSPEQIHSWKTMSEDQGTKYSLRSGREYGTFEI